MKRIWKLVSAFLWLSLLGALGALGLVAWVLLIYPKKHESTNAKVVEIEAGEQPSLREIAQQLQARGVIQQPFAFITYMKWIGADQHLRTGALHVPPNLMPAEVAAYMARGLGTIRVFVTIPEGFNRFDIAKRLEAEGFFSAQQFLQATTDRALLRKYAITNDSAEGYLFPDTYEFFDAVSPQTVVARMLGNWKRRMSALSEQHRADLARVSKELGWTRDEVVTLASIVEKEAAVREEQPIVAGVFYNRLTSKTFLPPKFLQADPTVIYGCLAEPSRAASCQGFSGHISKAMLLDASNRYNTYQHPGLPPGPICNPGADALSAALHPEQHNFFYFVAGDNRHHRFSETLKTHNRAVREYVKRQ